MNQNGNVHATNSHIPSSNGASAPDSPATPIRIILADSQPIYRMGVNRILSHEPDLKVVAQVEKLEQLRTLSADERGDVLILEGSMLAGTTNALPEIVALYPKLKIIVQTASAGEEHTVELYRKGVRGLIPRSITPELLIRCIHKIANGETWIDNQSVNWVIEAYRSQAVALTDSRLQPRLSQKELAIIAQITQGKRNKEIASIVGTTEQVVKNYLRKIYDKLGVSDRLELALYCLHHRLDAKTGDFVSDSRES